MSFQQTGIARKVKQTRYGLVVNTTSQMESGDGPTLGTESQAQIPGDQKSIKTGESASMTTHLIPVTVV